MTHPWAEVCLAIEGRSCETELLHCQRKYKFCVNLCLLDLLFGGGGETFKFVRISTHTHTRLAIVMYLYLCLSML
jgi:hypothetical protein